MARIAALLVSPRHRLAGRPAPETAAALPDDTVERVLVRAGLGIVGDRFYGQRAHRQASVTLITAEALAPWGAGLAAVRRNVLLEGVPIDDARGRTLRLDCDEGPVDLRLHRPANPCAWLDLTVGDGAWRGLRGHGGMRCEPLTDGVLRVGPVEATWV